jgi:hypothetical protein
MKFLKKIFRLLKLILFISSLIAGTISYISGIRKIKSNILEVRVPDEYCIYVRSSEKTKEIFHDDLHNTDCWMIKGLTLVFLTKNLNIGQHEFAEPLPGFEYYYNAHFSPFLMWYAILSFISVLIIHREFRFITTKK